MIENIFQGVVVFGLLYHEPLQYNDYLYPSWAEWIGWGLALSSILMIPGFMISQLIQAPGTFKEVTLIRPRVIPLKYSMLNYFIKNSLQKVAYSITPIEEHTLLKRSKKVTRFRSRHWLYI